MDRHNERDWREGRFEGMRPRDDYNRYGRGYGADFDRGGYGRGGAYQDHSGYGRRSMGGRNYMDEGGHPGARMDVEGSDLGYTGSNRGYGHGDIGHGYSGSAERMGYSDYNPSQDYSRSGYGQRERDYDRRRDDDRQRYYGRDRERSEEGRGSFEGRYGREAGRDRGYGDRGYERGGYDDRDWRNHEGVPYEARLGRHEDRWPVRGGSEGDYGSFREESFRGGSASSRETMGGPHAGKGPMGYTRSVERMREQVCERLTQHGQIDATHIEITVEENGEVTLSGTVDSREAKRMAEDVAESVPGVRDVHNRLRIGSRGAQGNAAEGAQEDGQTSQRTARKNSTS